MSTYYRIPDADQDTIREAIQVLRKHGLREARLLLEDEGEGWIIRQTACLIQGGAPKDGGRLPRV